MPRVPDPPRQASGGERGEPRPPGARGEDPEARPSDQDERGADEDRQREPVVPEGQPADEPEPQEGPAPDAARVRPGEHGGRRGDPQARDDEQRHEGVSAARRDEIVDPHVGARRGEQQRERGGAAPGKAPGQRRDSEHGEDPGNRGAEAQGERPVPEQAAEQRSDARLQRSHVGLPVEEGGKGPAVRHVADHLDDRRVVGARVAAERGRRPEQPRRRRREQDRKGDATGPAPGGRVRRGGAAGGNPGISRFGRGGAHASKGYHSRFRMSTSPGGRGATTRGRRRTAASRPPRATRTS